MSTYLNASTARYLAETAVAATYPSVLQQIAEAQRIATIQAEAARLVEAQILAGLEAARREEARLEAIRREAARREAARLEAARRREEEARQARQAREAARREAARLEAEKEAFSAYLKEQHALITAAAQRGETQISFTLLPKFTNRGLEAVSYFKLFGYNVSVSRFIVTIKWA